MKHSVEELIDVAYQYFPRGIAQRDAQYAETPEVARQKAARGPASARYNDWRALLRRLEARFPAERFAGVEVHNRSFFLQSATAAVHQDRCFTGELWYPSRDPELEHEKLEFFISFAVPYYAICRVRHVLSRHSGKVTGLSTERSFDMTADDLPYSEAIAEEIRRTFPDHEPIAPEVGLTVVPDVQAGNNWFGESTIFTCLFSDSW